MDTTSVSGVFSKLYVFGDSLSDAGRVTGFTTPFFGEPLPPADLGYSGRFTNAELFGDGGVWVETAADLLGLAADDVENFAVGGARAVGSLSAGELLGANAFLLPDDVDPAEIAALFGGATVSDEALALLPEDVRDSVAAVNDVWLTGQVANAAAGIAAAGGAPDGSAATFLIGGNDYTNFDPDVQTPEEFLGGLILNVLGSASAIARAGVDTLIYVTQPSITFAPASFLLVEEIAAEALPGFIEAGLSPEDAAEQAQNLAVDAVLAFDDLVDIQNQQLSLGIPGIAQAFGIDAAVVDLAGLAAAINDDRSAFGFSDALGVRILSGATPLEFVDLNGNGVPDLDVDPTTGAVLEELPLPFLPYDGDDDGAPEGFGVLDPSTLDLDNDELVFFDVLHPTAATHDIIGAFYAASIYGEVSFDDETGGPLVGSRFADVMFAVGGDDVVSAGRGDDTVFGGLGDDATTGGRGADIMVGGAGDDVVRGGRGADVVSGADGDDLVYGGSGSDVIALGDGNDVGVGGTGADVFVFSLSSSTDETNNVFGGGGHDVVYIEVAGEDVAAAEAAIAEFDGEGRFEFALGQATIQMQGVEEIVIGDGSDPFAAQLAYQLALDHLSDSALLTIADAALWNVVDPVVDQLV